MRCDLQLRFGDDRPDPIVWVEVNGMLDTAGEPITEAGVRYQARQAERRHVYAAANLNAPRVITAGVLCDPVMRTTFVHELLAPSIGRQIACGPEMRVAA